MIDEMHLQKGTQFHSGEYIGVNEDNELYKGIMVFMIASLKNTVPLVIKACPEVIVADNHPANMNAFNILLVKFEGSKSPT